MKPNLFRSIYKALGEQFPLLPRIRRRFWGLLFFCSLFLIIGIGENNLTIPVKAVEESHYKNQPAAVYKDGVVTPGLLTITHATFTETILLSNQTTDVDLFTLIFLAIGSGIIIWMAPKLYQHNFFRKDISNAICGLGYLIILHGLSNIFRIALYIPREIEKLTHNEFTSTTGFPITVYAELYFAMIVIALGGMYQRGMKLQEEQDLTV